jgi:hypothetical protein
MSILLFVIGAITLVAGALAIGFGIPINEFSFGNTLIMSGATAAVGGLIVIGLGAVVSHLQRVADVMATRTPVRPSRAPDVLDTSRAPPASRTLFSRKQKPEQPMEQMPPLPPLGPPVTEPPPAVTFAEEVPAEEEAPILPNPVEPPAEAVREEPRAPPPFFAAKPARAEFSRPAAPAGRPRFSVNGTGAGEHAPEPVPAWLTTPRSPEPPPPEPPPEPEEADFEAMWPPRESRAVDQRVGEERQPAAAAPRTPAARETAAPAPTSEHRSTVAILKSGVVDGMGYTLYVDGSIEAELPQGTLRFASINDLREHLEKAS